MAEEPSVKQKVGPAAAPMGFAAGAALLTYHLVPGLTDMATPEVVAWGALTAIWSPVAMVGEAVLARLVRRVKGTKTDLETPS